MMIERKSKQGRIPIEGEKPIGPWEVAIGATVLIDGIPLKVVNINSGKRRLTLQPFPDWPMCDVVSDPIQRVIRAKASP